MKKICESCNREVNEVYVTEVLIGDQPYAAKSVCYPCARKRVDAFIHVSDEDVDRILEEKRRKNKGLISASEIIGSSIKETPDRDN